MTKIVIKPEKLLIAIGEALLTPYGTFFSSYFQICFWISEILQNLKLSFNFSFFLIILTNYILVLSQLKVHFVKKNE